MRIEYLWTRRPVSGDNAWNKIFGVTGTTTVELSTPAKHLSLRLPIIPILTLTLLAVSMLNPSPIASVSAEGSTIEARVVVQPVLGLAIGSNHYVVDVTPTETGEFSSQTSSVIVTTNNETGYSLYLATVNGRATLASTEGQRRLIRSLVRYPQLDSELIPGDII